jgi:hypothetical protein
VTCPVVPYFSTLSHKLHDFRGKEIVYVTSLMVRHIQHMQHIQHIQHIQYINLHSPRHKVLSIQHLFTGELVVILNVYCK